MKRIVEWIIKRYLKGYHLHLNPTKKTEPPNPKWKGVKYPSGEDL